MLAPKNFKLLIAFLLFPFLVFAQETKVSFLKVQGNSKQAFVYQDGNLETNTSGAIKKAKLATNQIFSPQGSNTKLFFLAGCDIEFNAVGKVIKGTPAINYRLRLPGGKTTAFFKGGCEVEFNTNGQVIRGALYFPQHFKVQGSTTLQYIEQNALITFNSLGEVASFIPNGCTNYGCEVAVTGTRSLKGLYDIINGVNKDYDKTVLTVLKRNNWTNTLAVVDVTESMDPYVAQVYLWLKLNSTTNQTKYYVFFNDGDGKPDASKVIGSTGGVYGTNTTNLDMLLQTMVAAMKNGDGGDMPENDIEAMIYGQNKSPGCSSIIHVADNNATPRDLSLLYKVNKPVHVIACGVSSFVNPALLDIARKTGGTLSTIEEDIRNLSGLSIGSTISVGGHTYRLDSDGFKYVY
jgi:hypothetical protein